MQVTYCGSTHKYQSSRYCDLHTALIGEEIYKQLSAGHNSVKTIPPDASFKPKLKFWSVLCSYNGVKGQKNTPLLSF